MLTPGKYIVLGLGITGCALIDFLIEQKVEVVAFDEEEEEKFKKVTDKYSKEYSKQKINFFFKNFPKKVFEDCQGVFVSPGVPLTRSWIQEAKTKKIPIIGELELASRYLQQGVVAVTGTNGKSTTVTLLDSILKEGGLKSGLKGNIGSPLITALAEPPKDIYVVEVSSYQLETIESFHPKISVLLNITEDHLERYKDCDDYARAKARIFMNQTANDTFIYNADDPYCLRMSKASPARPIPFSLVNSFVEGGFVDSEEMVMRIGEREDRYSLAECSLKGLHNQENMLAAILSAMILGVKKDSIAKALANFKSLSHRMELAGVYEGISFYDDSKGTNVGAVVMSLASFEKGVILILGGRDKGGDYSPLKSLISGKVKALIVLGEAKLKILEKLEGLCPTYSVENIKEAVEKSFEMGSAEDVVLLSPACSSFDQYKNYAERGRDFQKWVSYFGERKKRTK